MKDWQCIQCNKEITTNEETHPTCCNEPMKRIWCSTMHGGKNVPIS